jgi:hypothetical protein
MMKYLKQHVGRSVKKETHVNILVRSQKRRLTLRSVDVLVHGWIRGEHVGMNLTEVSPHVVLGTGDFTVGHAALKAASSKVAKHEKRCSDNQHIFISFAFDTFGFLALARDC